MDPKNTNSKNFEQTLPDIILEHSKSHNNIIIDSNIKEYLGSVYLFIHSSTWNYIVFNNYIFHIEINNYSINRSWWC